MASCVDRAMDFASSGSDASVRTASVAFAEGSFVASIASAKDSSIASDTSAASTVSFADTAKASHEN